MTDNDIDIDRTCNAMENLDVRYEILLLMCQL